MITKTFSRFWLGDRFAVSMLNRSKFSEAKVEPQKILEKYYKKNELLEGYCNSQATKNYRDRFVSTKQAHQSFYSKLHDSNLHISQIGIGTQNGEPTPVDDLKMTQILTESMSSGINFIDTDINFRYGKSQKVINACLNYLIQQKGFKREEFFISTKFGYIPTDVDSDLTSEKLIEILKSERFIQDENVVEGIYGWGEGFVEFCIEKSRLSLGLETIDNVFMNNFSEAQMALVSEDQFKRRLRITLKKLQEVRGSKRIRNYGVCSFVGFRSPPNEENVHLNLQSLCNMVRDLAGSDNGFKYIMLPLSLGMPEALLKWQKYQQKNKEQIMRIFDVAQKEGLKIILCSPLFQGRVASLPFSSPKLNYLHSNAAKHLQFVRSIQSSALVTTVFGTNNLSHLKQNLEIMTKPKVTKQDWNSILPIPE